MISVSRHLKIAGTLARISLFVLVFLLGHDAIMAMEPHHTDSSSHHGHVLDVEECGSSEGVAQSIPGPQAGPVPVSVTTVNIGPGFAIDDTLPTAWIDPGQDASAIRVWQQVYRN